METNSFGAKLQEYRKKHFLTQQKMAELLGVSPNHVGVLERGIKQPRASTEAAFARISGQWISAWSPLEISPGVVEVSEYDQLWERLGEIESDRRAEVMDVFLQILKWI